MKKPNPRFVLTAVAVSLLPLSASSAARTGMPFVTPEEKIQYMRRARVWEPAPTSRLDLLRGPVRDDGFDFEQEVSCRYVDPSPVPDPYAGMTAKFKCMLGPKDKLKVRCHEYNGEVYASVAASRLFWALGFGAEPMYPTQIICKNCPEEPWEIPGEGAERATRRITPAVVERKFAQEKIEVEDQEHTGWKWSDLDLIDESMGGSPRAHVDALRLMVAVLQHGDSRARQQYVVCRDGALRQRLDGKTVCTQPWMFVHDLGSTFGASAEEITEKSKMHFHEWASQPVWKDASTCTANLHGAYDGTIHDPVVSEAGRAFLASLLSRLSDQQLRDLFTAARVDLRARIEEETIVDSSGNKRWVNVEDWVQAFKAKRREITEARCPARRPS